MKRKLLKKRESISYDFSYVSIKELKKELNFLEKMYGEDAIIDIDYSENYGADVEIVYERLENDKEFNARKKKSESAKKAAKARAEKEKKNKELKELKEYKRLKKKFEGANI